MQEVRQWDGAAQRLPHGEDELLYGRAGYLYCLLFLHKHIEPMTDAAPMVGTPLHRCTFVTHQNLQVLNDSEIWWLTRLATLIALADCNAFQLSCTWVMGSCCGSHARAQFGSIG